MYLILTGDDSMEYSEGLKARQAVLAKQAKEIEERTARLCNARSLELVAGTQMGPELREAFLLLRRDALLLQQADYLLKADALKEMIEHEDKRPIGPFDGIKVPDITPPGGF